MDPSTEATPPPGGGNSDVQSMMRRLVDVFSDAEIDQLAMLQQQQDTLAPLRVATVCSGTDAPVRALERVLEVLNERDTTTTTRRTIEHVFSCENVAFKRDFIHATATSSSSPPIIFTDLLELANDGGGMCHDGEQRALPTSERLDLLVASPAGKDFSTLSSSRVNGLEGRNRRCKGDSAATFWGTVDVVQRTQPAVVLLENVATCPAQDMQNAFATIGYNASAQTKVCTSDYLLPQTRKRTVFVFLRDGAFKFRTTPDAWVATLHRLGQERYDPEDTPHLQWTDFLMNEHDRQTAPAKRSGNRGGKPLAESSGTKWLAEVKAIEDKEGLVKYNAPGGRPYSLDKPSLAYLPDRAKLRLDVQFKRAVKAGIDPLDTPLLWNPAVQLRFAGYAGLDTTTMDTQHTPRAIAPLVTPSHEWIVSTRQAAFSGPEALALQGIRVPLQVQQQFTDAQLRDLAGNASSTTVVAAVFLATCLTTTAAEAEDSDEVVVVEDDEVADEDDENDEGPVPPVGVRKRPWDRQTPPKRRTRNRSC